MLGTSSDQKGFSAVEAMLAAIIVILIVFTGYYIWHNQTKANNTPNVISKTSQSAPPKAAVQQHYVTIKEWGVRAPYDGNLTLEYAIQGSDPNADPAYAGFTSAELDAGSPTCKADDGQVGISAVGIIDRYGADQDYLVGDDGEDSGQTAAQHAATLSKSDYGHVGNYYYFYTSPQATCAADQASQNIFDQTQTAVKALLPKLQSVPSY